MLGKKPGRELRWDGLPSPPASALLAQLWCGPRGILRRFEELNGNGVGFFSQKGVVWAKIAWVLLVTIFHAWPRAVSAVVCRAGQ